MSSTQGAGQARAAAIPGARTVDLKLEVVAIPVADVDRAKQFYEGLGWRLDADFTVGDHFRGLQMTPPGSPCSVHFGKGVTTAAPGSAHGMVLVVDDIEAARADLIARGADVGETFHFAFFGGPPLPGPDPERGSYKSWASFSDPDGNRWMLQEITTRLPGRGLGLDGMTLPELLREAEAQHGEHGAKAPAHHWSDWYAGYLAARSRGRTAEEAAQDAANSVSANPAGSSTH